MTQKELSEAYALSARPFIEAPGPTPADKLKLKSWRYVIEVNSTCNLKCILCASGNRNGYDYQSGIMDMDLLQRVLDKIATENPAAVVCCYANSEPFAHPRIDEVVAHIKMRGFRCELSSNFNIWRNVEATYQQHPDLFTVSVSGWTQDVYGRHHVGGDVELVKENLSKLAEIHSRSDKSICVGVSYHMYRDNTGEDQMGEMKRFAEELGFQFLVSWARVITLEPTVAALRYLDKQDGIAVEPYSIRENGINLNEILPEANPDFIKNMDLLQFHPKRARQVYARFPVAPVCIIADVFTYIRWDGRVQLCPWVDDMRMTLGNYLDMSQEELSAARRGYPFCKECLKYRLNLYFHIVDCTKFDNGGYV